MQEPLAFSGGDAQLVKEQSKLAEGSQRSELNSEKSTPPITGFCLGYTTGDKDRICTLNERSIAVRFRILQSRSVEAAKHYYINGTRYIKSTRPCTCY